MKKKRLKIGLFIDTYFPMIDGVVMVVDNYASLLSKYADVTVFAPETDKEYVDKFKYKVIRCKSLKTIKLDYDLPIPDIDFALRRKLKKEKLDLIHVHSPFTIGRLGIKYAKKYDIPLIATMHSQYKKDFYRVTKSEVISNILTQNIIKQFDKCDQCWAVNSEVAKIFYNDYGYKKMPLVVGNATDMKPVKNKIKSDNYINAKYNLKEDDIVFLFVGRLNKLKNIMFIADALNVLNKKDINFKMLFVGDGQDREKLEEKIKKYNIEDKVIFCGRVEDRKEMQSIYARAKLFLFPSLYDCSSLVQIEAASQCTPTVFVEGSATSDNVTNNVNGFIAKNNVNDYARKIEEILNNKELYERVSKGAFKDIYITWDKLVENVYNRYQNLILEKKKKV